MAKDDQNRHFARDDPDGFIRGLEYAVIDEIQRVPDMLLALKKQVDEDPRPGRFLITGSVDLFAASSSPDSLAGRVETITLLPFSQAEIAGTPPPGFLDQVFIGGFATYQNTGPTADLIERVVSGGFPLALARSDPLRRRAWILSYARSLAERDVYDLAKSNQTGRAETPNGADSDLIRPTAQYQSPCRSTRRGRQDCGSLDHPIRADVPCSPSEGTTMN